MAKNTTDKSLARKTSDTPTKIFTIGAFCKLSAEERQDPQQKVIHDLVFGAFRYRRALIDIENARRAAFRALRRSLHPALNEFETEVDRLDSEIAELRKGLKTKKARSTPEQVQRIDAITKLKEARRDIYPQITKAHADVKKQHFDKLDKLFAEQKTARLAQAAKKKGVPALGPNDPVRREVMQKLDEDMAARKASDAWVSKRQIDLKAEEANRVARGETLCNSGTYLAVEEAVKRAKRDAPGGDLRQKRWDNTGRIGIQLTGGKGLTVERALSGQDEKLKLEICEDLPLRKNKSDDFYPSHSRPTDLHAKQRAARAKLYARHPEKRPYRKVVTARMKLSGHTKDAVHLDIRGVLHRPLPADGIIKWAFLNVDRVGYDMFYELQLVMESAEFAIQRAGRGSDKKLAINFGWRVMPDGNIRVATTWDGRKPGHIILDQSLLERDRLSQRLIGHSDEHFDGVRDEVISWLGELPASDRVALLPRLRLAMPERLREDLQTIDQIKTYMTRWRGHERLAKVANVLRDLYLDQETVKRKLSEWRKHRFSKKLDLFASHSEFATWALSKKVLSSNARMALYLETWRAKDRHLVNWARHGQTKLGRHRRDIYRNRVAQWAKEYGKVAIEKWDKSKTARTPKYENDSRTPREENANSIRQFAAIYGCTTALGEKFGEDLLQESAVNISVEHFGCGGTSLTPPGESQTPVLRCSGCKKDYDQDVNAARHLWNRAFTAGGSEQAAPAPKRKRLVEVSRPVEVSRKPASQRKNGRNLDTAAE